MALQGQHPEPARAHLRPCGSTRNIVSPRCILFRLRRSSWLHQPPPHPAPPNHHHHHPPTSNICVDTLALTDSKCSSAPPPTCVAEFLPRALTNQPIPPPSSRPTPTPSHHYSLLVAELLSARAASVSMCTCRIAPPVGMGWECACMSSKLTRA